MACASLRSSYFALAASFVTQVLLLPSGDYDLRLPRTMFALPAHPLLDRLDLRARLRLQRVQHLLPIPPQPADARNEVLLILGLVIFYSLPQCLDDRLRGLFLVVETSNEPRLAQQLLRLLGAELRLPLLGLFVSAYAAVLRVELGLRLLELRVLRARQLLGVEGGAEVTFTPGNWVPLPWPSVPPSWPSVPPSASATLQPWSWCRPSSAAHRVPSGRDRNSRCASLCSWGKEKCSAARNNSGGDNRLCCGGLEFWGTLTDSTPA